MGPGIMWPTRNGRAKPGCGLLRLTVVQKCPSETEMGDDRPGLKADGFAIVRDGFVEPALVREQSAQVIAPDPELWIEPNRLTVVALGLDHGTPDVRATRRG